MATVSVPQPDRVAAVLATAPQWVHGRRKADGAEFWILPSSDGGRTYYASTRGCTCPAARNGRTGDCKHQAAIREYLEVDGANLSTAQIMAEAAEASRQNPCELPIEATVAVRPTRDRYSDLFPADAD